MLSTPAPFAALCTFAFPDGAGLEEIVYPQSDTLTATVSHSHTFDGSDTSSASCVVTVAGLIYHLNATNASYIARMLARGTSSLISPHATMPPSGVPRS